MRPTTQGLPCELGNHYKGSIMGKRTRAADWAELERQWEKLPESERGAVVIFPSCPMCGAVAAPLLTV
jgi:hypothetical protein